MAAHNINRFQFLRGDFSGRRFVIRPPWSITETAFTEQCSRCQACVEQCPEKILVKGRAGFPEVDFFRGECSFCQRCADVCETPALNMESAEPWLIRAEINSDCLAFKGVLCRTCSELCEAGAIRFRPVIGGGAVPMLSTDQCNGCGACVAPCPNKAIQLSIPNSMEESVA